MKYRKAWTEGPYKVGTDMFSGTHVYDAGGDRLTNDRMNGREDWKPTAHLLANAERLFEALQAIVDYEASPDFSKWKRLTDEARSALLAADGQDALRPQGDTSDVG